VVALAPAASASGEGGIATLDAMGEGRSGKEMPFKLPPSRQK
jgi:hypothetical protein